MTSIPRISSAIEGDLTIYRVQQVKAELLEMLADAAELELDLRQVSDIDTAGVQLLMLIKREALRREKSLRLTAHSNPVLEAFEQLNVAAYFGDPLLIARQDSSSVN